MRLKGKPKIGAAGELTFSAETRHEMEFADNQRPAVLYTSWLIWFPDRARSVLPPLDALMASRKETTQAGGCLDTLTMRDLRSPIDGQTV